MCACLSPDARVCYGLRIYGFSPARRYSDAEMYGVADTEFCECGCHSEHEEDDDPYGDDDQ